MTLAPPNLGGCPCPCPGACDAPGSAPEPPIADSAWFAESGCFTDTLTVQRPCVDTDPCDTWTETIAGLTASEYTPGLNPVFLENQINGYPALEFAGSQKLLTGSGEIFPAATSGWFLVVLKFNGSADRVVVDSAWGAGRQTLYLDSANQPHVQSAALNVAYTGTAPDGDTWFILGGIFNDAGDSTIAFSPSGIETGSGTPDSIESIAIGEANGGGAGFVGMITAILRGNTVITYAELKAKADILATKYGIDSLPTPP